MMGNPGKPSAMGRRFLMKAGVTAGVGLYAAASAQAAAPAAKITPAEAADMIKDWPDAAKAAADAMLREYGPPQEATATMLIWHDNGPWVRTIAYRDEVEHNFPTPHKDVLEQVVKFKVPLNFFNALAVYDGSVIVDRTRGEVAARSGGEPTNFLALNLVDDIVHGRRTAEQAREFHTQTVRALMAGKTPEVTRKLQFNSQQQGDTADPDTPTLAPASGTSTPGPARIR